MKARAALLCITTAALSALSLAACSGSDDASIFDPPPPQPETPGNQDPGGSFINGNQKDSGTTKPLYCSPAEMQSFAPAWRAPGELNQGVCSAAQIGSFWDACLATPTNSPECQKFVAANAACSRCLQSQDTDAVQGAVQWHRQGTYYTVNLSGCIARTLGDVSASGCGAAYDAALECRRDSCDACFDTQNPSFQKFSECQSSAGKTVCKTYGDAWRAKCPDVRAGASAKCFPTAANATAKDAYLAIAPLFCSTLQ